MWSGLYLINLDDFNHVTSTYQTSKHLSGEKNIKSKVYNVFLWPHGKRHFVQW